MEVIKSGGQLSRSLFGIEWKTHFPLLIPTSQVVVQVSSFQDVSKFLGANYGRIFESHNSDNHFYSKDSHEKKRRYYEVCGDFFAFYSDEKIVATFIGNPVDWSTYYIRNIAVLPEFQGRGLYQTFLLHLFDILRSHQVDRVEVETSPANLASVHVLNKLQFNVTGQSLTERWGAVTQFTKYLNKNCESVFLDSFCDGIRPQVRTPAGST